MTFPRFIQKIKQNKKKNDFFYEFEVFIEVFFFFCISSKLVQSRANLTFPLFPINECSTQNLICPTFWSQKGRMFFSAEYQFLRNSLLRCYFYMNHFVQYQILLKFDTFTFLVLQNNNNKKTNRLIVDRNDESYMFSLKFSL